MCATCESIAGATGDETTPTTCPDAAAPETQESRQVGVNLDTCTYYSAEETATAFTSIKLEKETFNNLPTV